MLRYVASTYLSHNAVMIRYGSMNNLAYWCLLIIVWMLQTLKLQEEQFLKHNFWQTNFLSGSLVSGLPNFCIIFTTSSPKTGLLSSPESGLLAAFVFGLPSRPCFWSAKSFANITFVLQMYDFHVFCEFGRAWTWKELAWARPNKAQILHNDNCAHGGPWILFHCEAFWPKKWVLVVKTQISFAFQPSLWNSF